MMHKEEGEGGNVRTCLFSSFSNQGKGVVVVREYRRKERCSEDAGGSVWYFLFLTLPFLLPYLQ